jgi:hypothetical protein
LVDEIIARVEEYHIIRVRGTPASGKTTVRELVANKLFEIPDRTRPIYVFNGWHENDVRRATGWNEYLKRETGVHGDEWHTYSAYLLLDEAQQSHWDDRLWSDLFKRVGGFPSNPFIVLFSSYGSPGRGFAGYDEKHIKIPMVFAAEQQISMRPDENIEGYRPHPLQTWIPVGLLLDENEAIDVSTRFASYGMHPGVSLTADLKKELFLVSDGHVGLLVSLIGALRLVPVSIPLVIYSPGVNVHYNRKPMPLYGEISRLIRRQ